MAQVKIGVQEALSNEMMIRSQITASDLLNQAVHRSIAALDSQSRRLNGKDAEVIELRVIINRKAGFTNGVIVDADATVDNGGLSK